MLKDQVQLKVYGEYALFTDPLTKVGGEKCSYHIPTYESLKGILSSVYWKPTIRWVIDKMRVLKPIRTQTKGTKPLKYSGGNELAIYTYLVKVEYQVLAHFEWNLNRKDMAHDRNEGKHWSVAKRLIERGGRRDIFLGTRECQGYVEPCVFGKETGFYDHSGEIAYGLMFHGFDYPDETGINDLRSRFWWPKMNNGIVHFIRPEQCTICKFVKKIKPSFPKSTGLEEESLRLLADERAEL